jgi:hypothetical protein
MEVIFSSPSQETKRDEPAGLVSSDLLHQLLALSSKLSGKAATARGCGPESLELRAESFITVATNDLNERRRTLLPLAWPEEPLSSP